MSSIELSREEADALADEQKELVDNDQIHWNDVGKALTIKFQVQTHDGILMTVRGWVSKRSKRYGFALLFRERTPIRRWDMKAGHKDPITRQKSSGPHKHYYDPNYDDSRSYDTSDIPTDNVREALIAFLKECLISFNDTRIPHPILASQQRLQDFGD